MALNVINDNGRVDANDDLSAIDTVSNSYASVSAFLTYWLDRNLDYTDYDIEAVQAALLKASDYIERRFGQVFKGTRIDGTQALAWPRYGVYSRDGVLVEGVPPALRTACIEYAARSLLGTALWSDPVVNPNVRKIVSGIGPIREEVEYVGGGLTSETFPLADSLIAPYIIAAGGVMR